jgi:Surface-adhesin protein E
MNMRNIAGLFICTAQILLLSSCALLSPKSHRGHQAHNVNFKSQSNLNSAGNNQQEVITSLSFALNPSQAIEINGLSINYSMIAAPDEDGYFDRLTLVFTNLTDKPLSISPKLTLRDGRGSEIKAYSKNGFLLLASHMSKKQRGVITSLIETNNDRQNAAKERKEWANAYWLKEKYIIPPHGIALGGIFYRCTKLILPMRLTVNAAGREFVFAPNDSLQVLNGQYEDEHRYFDMFIGIANSPSGLTAYVNPSTIRKDGNKVAIWSLFDFQAARTAANGQTYMSARSLSEYDCKASKSRLLAFSWYSKNMGGGKVVFSNSDIQEWEPVLPDSLIGSIWKYACWKK